MLIAAGQNNLRVTQARLSANGLADEVETLFENDFDLETQYHSLLNGKKSRYRRGRADSIAV